MNQDIFIQCQLNKLPINQIQALHISSFSKTKKSIFKQTL